MQIDPGIGTSCNAPHTLSPGIQVDPETSTRCGAHHSPDSGMRFDHEMFAFVTSNRNAFVTQIVQCWDDV